MLADDLDVFYDADDFAHVCTRVRVGEADLPFTALFDVADEALFDGHVVTGAAQLRYPTAAVDLTTGDVVQVQRKLADGSLSPAQPWKVLRRPTRLLARVGVESIVLLAPGA